MATVTVDVNGRPHSVGCADGQEERVRILAGEFDAHVRSVAEDVGQIGDLKLFLMAGLMLADQLQEARMASDNGEPLPAAPALHPATPDGVAEALNAVAARIEKIVQSI